MGVSLQIYRVRIGTFQPKYSIGTSRTNQEYNKSIDPRTYTLVWLLCCAVLTLLAPFGNSIRISQTYNQELGTCNTVSCVTSPCPPGSKSGMLCPSTSEPIHLLHAPSSWLTRRQKNSKIKRENGNRGQRGRGIKIIAWNKGNSHLQNKHPEIESIIAGHQPHILGLSEANLHKTTDPRLVQHQDYQLHTAPTMDTMGISRVVVYSHSSLVVKRRSDLEDTSLSAIWLEVGLPRQKKILICNIYREWQLMSQGPLNQTGSVAAQLNRWVLFLDKWEAALGEGREVIVLGDINLDFLKWSKDLPASDSSTRLKGLTDCLFRRIFPLGVSQLVRSATREAPHSPPSGLDHIYTNKPYKCSEAAAEYTGGSDHKLIKVTRFCKSFKSNIRYVRKRVFKDFSAASFCEAVRQLSWFELYMCESPSQAAELLTSSLSTILDQMAPIRTIQVRKKYVPWLSPDTKELMKQRDAAQAKAAESKCQDDWRLYKNLRNTTTARVRAEKKAWEQNKLDSTQQDSNTIWNSVKSWLSWGNAGPPSKLFVNGEMLTSPARLAGAMNNFFLDKVRLLKEKLPAASTDPLAKLRESMQGRECTFSMQPVRPEQVAKIIAGLKNSKSTGADHINTWIIKLVAVEILPAVTHIINLSISNSEFPTLWKLAKVVPLLKKDDPVVPKNYRPVALLPVLSKILEKAVFLQLVEYLDENGLFSVNHHGSRHNHNTATALMQMYDQWVEEVETGKMVGVMMIDLSAAFDMVDHALLLQKLEIFGLNSSALRWMESYLKNRYQSVCIDGCVSPPLLVECGVPQGSILGPLLYVLFTNDIPDLVHDHSISHKSPVPYCKSCGSTVCYVDDCTFSYGHSHPATLSEKLTAQYKIIAEYMAANKLVINSDKTHLVVMGTRATTKYRAEVTIQAGQHIIKPTRVEKLLGGQVSENLKWRDHILGGDQSLVKQLTNRINGLQMIAAKASLATRLSVANGIFMSKLSYLIQLWGGTEGYLLKALQVTQNKAARAVTRMTWFTPTRVLLNKCGWLSVKQMVFYHRVVTAHKVIKAKAPFYLHRKMSTNHPYQTRQAADGAIRFGEHFEGRSLMTGNSFCYNGTMAYNMIPAEVRAAKTHQNFKYKLRKWVMSHIPVE